LAETDEREDEEEAEVFADEASCFPRASEAVVSITEGA
jgi:hypothetical protein